jgi:hypothetical protein
VTYSNNLEKIETIRDDGLIEGADPTIAALTGRIDVRFWSRRCVRARVGLIEEGQWHLTKSIDGPIASIQRVAGLAALDLELPR